jgi:hypothetical protein
MGLVWRSVFALRNIMAGVVLRKRPQAEEQVQVEAASVMSTLDEYVDSMPCAQNAVNLIPGWNHALPPEVGAVAGTSALYEDARIDWCLEQFGNISGRRVLELGPLEASHTYMLNRHAPERIDAIEANKLSFLRCLIVKDLLSLDRARFMIGDFEKWLERSGQRYDLIVASGVLYHMADPVRLLELASGCSDAIFLWTHYFSEEAMPENDSRRGAMTGKVDIRPFKGVDIRLHKRSYHGAWRDKAFCGGIYDQHSWMEKSQILEILSLLGFEDIRTTECSPKSSRTEKEETPTNVACSSSARSTSPMSRSIWSHCRSSEASSFRTADPFPGSTGPMRF